MQNTKTGVIKMNIKYEDFHLQQLKNPEYQKEWLRVTALEYIKTGNYENFFSDLEDVIKANTTVTEYAERVNMNRNQLIKLLNGTTKAPSLDTINKVISGLGLNYELKAEIQLVQKSA